MHLSSNFSLMLLLRSVLRSILSLNTYGHLPLSLKVELDYKETIVDLLWKWVSRFFGEHLDDFLRIPIFRIIGWIYTHLLANVVTWPIFL